MTRRFFLNAAFGAATARALPTPKLTTSQAFAAFGPLPLTIVDIRHIMDRQDRFLKAYAGYKPEISA